jgi:hypothetical protein
MADVTFSLSFEDLDSLLANEQLPSDLAAVFEHPALLGLTPPQVEALQVLSREFEVEPLRDQYHQMIGRLEHVV